MRMHHVSGISLGRTARAASAKTLLAAALVALGCTALAARAQAAVLIEYPNFSSVSGLQLNGAAKQNGSQLQLTPAETFKQSSAFATTPIDPSQSWSTQFEVSMSASSGLPADGIAFLLQSDPRGDKAVSESDEGGAMGYAGITPSLGLEFDIYDLNPGDPDADHIGIIENGDPSKYIECATENTIATPCDKEFKFPLYSETSKPVYGWLAYEGATNTLSVYANNTSTQPSTPLLQVVVNLGSLLGKSAFAGFTSATGAGDAFQEVFNWQFSGSQGSATTPPSGPSGSATSTQVICNLVIATASDTCTATVGGASSGNPTGTVTFTSSNGGVFSAGNTCDLTPGTFSTTTSSCSVQFLPPTSSTSAPAITATYSGDTHHSPSSGQTTYKSASELQEDITIAKNAVISANGNSVEVPISCQFPCSAAGTLTSGPDEPGAGMASFLGLGSSPTAAVLAKAKKPGRKKKTAKAVVLGKGSLTLSKPGKGTLLIKLTAKAKQVFKKAKGKPVKGVLEVTVKTTSGTLVKTEKLTITIRPQVKKPKKKGRHGKH